MIAAVPFGFLSVCAATNFIELFGRATVGWPGLAGVEWWLRPNAGTNGKLADDDPAWAMAEWKPALIDPPPTDWGGGLPLTVLFAPNGERVFFHQGVVKPAELKTAIDKLVQ